MEGSRTAK